MRLKEGVKLTGLTPQMALAAIIVDRVYAEHGHECTITSANDSKHMDTSLHYQGRALDFRTRDVTEGPGLILADIKARLGSEFDVVLEVDHIHCEWDVK